MLKYYLKWRMGPELWFLYNSLKNDEGWDISSYRALHQKLCVVVRRAGVGIEVQIFPTESKNFVSTPLTELTYDGFGGKIISAWIKKSGVQAEIRANEKRKAERKAQLLTRLAVGE